MLETLQHLFVGTWEYIRLKLLILYADLMAFVCRYVELFLGSADVVDSLILTGGRQLGSLYSEAANNNVPVSSTSTSSTFSYLEDPDFNLGPDVIYACIFSGFIQFLLLVACIIF